MNKRYAIISLFAILGISIASGFVWAYGFEYNTPTHNNLYPSYHEDIENIIENGTYKDLENYRNQLNRNIIPWVTDEETFQQLKERHEQMEEYREEGRGIGLGFGRRHGRNGFRGCPMM